MTSSNLDRNGCFDRHLDGDNAADCEGDLFFDADRERDRLDLFDFDWERVRLLNLFDFDRERDRLNLFFDFDRERDRLLDLFDFDRDFLDFDFDLCLDGEWAFFFDFECFFTLCLDVDLLCDLLRLDGELLPDLLCFFDLDCDFLDRFDFECDLLLERCFWDFPIGGDTFESDTSLAFDVEWPFDFDLDRLLDVDLCLDLEFERDLLFDFDRDRDLFFPLDLNFDTEGDDCRGCALSVVGEVGRGRLVWWGEWLRDFLRLRGDFDNDL